MRLMSFALTTPQIMQRTKTVTRRLGWRSLKPGSLLLAVDRCMGFQRGESPTPLAVLRVTGVRRERLYSIEERVTSSLRLPRSQCRSAHDLAFSPRVLLDDVQREGFDDMTPKQFVAMFCQHMGCTPETEVTRIEFQYVPGGRFAVRGFCRVCGCTEESACRDEDAVSCWWVDDRGRGALGQTSLCSHCFEKSHCFESRTDEGVHPTATRKESNARSVPQAR